MELLNLTKYLINQLLPDVEGIDIREINNEPDKVIQVLIPPEYMSLIIGKGGKIANSIRTIVQATAYTKKLGRVRIDIDSL